MAKSTSKKKQTKKDSAPLEGLRVVELGDPIGAPLAGMLLADQGAEVIRVVDTGKAPEDPVLDAILARAKTEMPLDLGDEDDLAILERLLARADVVIESEGSRAMRRLGVDFETLRKERNPGLVSCSLTAFPEGDPRESMPDYDSIAGAAGLIYEKPLGPPRYHEFAVGPVMNGLFGAIGVMAALVARQTTGRGQHVDTSEYHSNLFAQLLQVLIKTGVPRGFLPFKMIGTPFIKRWQCGDGRWIFLHITLPAHCQRILEILEENGYRAEVRELRSIISEETFTDPSQVKSIAEAKAIREAYEKVFMTKSAQEWEDLIGKELCCIKVRTIEEWVDDSNASGMSDIVEVDDPVFGRLKVPGPVVTPLKDSFDVQPRKRDRNAAEVALRKWERRAGHYRRAEARKAKGSLKAPLEGTRVLDLSRIIAGPCAGRVLAELGADVISLQNPTNLDWALSFHLVFNNGKRSVTLDFKNDDGKEKLWKIIEKFDPDVLLQNYRNLDVAKAVGIDPDAVLSRYPRVAYTYLNAYGNTGEWQHRPGFEQVVQAVSGIQATYSRDGVPVLFPSPIVDIGCGLAGALGALINLYARGRTDTGGVATTHLTNQSVLFQVGALAAMQRDSGLATARSKGVAVSYDPGAAVFSRVVRTRDKWALLAGPKDDIEQWLKQARIEERWWLPGEGLLSVAEKIFALKPLTYWQDSVESAGVGDTVVLFDLPRMRSLLDDVQKNDTRDLLPAVKKMFPGVDEPLTFVRGPLRFSETQIIDSPPSPERGGDTTEVLKMIGVDLPPRSGIIHYPENKPLWDWAMSFVRWGYFAWRAGQI